MSRNPRHLPVGTEENYENSQDVTDALAEIRNKNLPNTSLERQGFKVRG
jgi:hypothetical protein